MCATPTWLCELADLIAAKLYPIDPLAPLGCHHYFDQATQQWEVTLFVGGTRVIGGPCDGRTVSSRFVADLLPIARAFETIDAMRWQSDRAGNEDDVGAHLAIEGRFHGDAVHLRLCAQAPASFEPSREVRIYEKRMVDLW